MIVGQTMLLYGKDYLAYALKSLEPYVDKHVILYTPVPNFGSTTNLPCPDTRDELRAIAESVLGKKLIWREGLPVRLETILNLVPEARLIFVADADEIWPVKLIAGTLRAWRDGNLKAMNYRVAMQHFWRSFNFVCRDNSWPFRVCVPRGNPANEGRIWDDNIHHFGYARTLADTRYKIETSAHKGEWRARWWEDIFTAFPHRLTDLHPVVSGLWNAQPYDRQRLPDFMHQHPWFDQEVIA